MTIIGFHASHEQFSPHDLLKWMPKVQEAGFQSVMSSDHIAPWSVRQGHSGYAWSWLGAAMQATTLPFGSLAIPGGWRYHPVMVAHATATLAQMFPHRFQWIAAGSGEAMNEHVIGAGWPDKAERNQRLKEGVDIIRALWRGENVTRKGIIPVEGAKLWDLPEKAPQIYAAALSQKTAEWAGEWADGLLTIRQPPDKLQNMIDAYRRGGGQGDIVIQINLSWAMDEKQARWNAWDQWRNNTLGSDACALFRYPEDFDKAGNDIDIEDIDKSFLISADPGQHQQWIQEYIDMGIDRIYIHNSGRNQEEFLACCQNDILPGLRF